LREAAHIISNEWYRAINNDSWYKYKPNQHINGVKLHWENPNIPDYTVYLKPKMQARNPTLLGSMGLGQPIYGCNLQVQPFHAAEPEHFPEATFDLLSNLLNPHINQAIATLGDLGVTADVFHLRQLPLKYLNQAQQMAYLGHEQDHIQQDQGLLHLAKWNLELEEAAIKECLRAAQVFLCITPHLNYDQEPGEVPAQLHYPCITNRGAQYKYNMQSTARLARGRQGRHSYRVARAVQALRMESPCIYCSSY